MIPSSVTSIGAGSFGGASKLKSVTITPSSALKIGKGAFDGISGSATVKIRADKSLYKKIKSKIKKSGATDLNFKRLTAK